MPFITAKFDSNCAECGDDIAEGDEIFYDGKPFCIPCAPEEKPKNKVTSKADKSKLLDRYR